MRRILGLGVWYAADLANNWTHRGTATLEVALRGEGIAQADVILRIFGHVRIDWCMWIGMRICCVSTSHRVGHGCWALHLRKVAAEVANCVVVAIEKQVLQHCRLADACVMYECVRRMCADARLSGACVPRGHVGMQMIAVYASVVCLGTLVLVRFERPTRSLCL